MAKLTIDIPAGDVLDTLIVAATEYLTQKEIDTASMTQAQIGQAYIRAILKDVYINRKVNGDKKTVEETISANAQTYKANSELIL